MRLQSPNGIHDGWRRPESLRAPAFRMIDRIYYVGNRDVSAHLVESEEGLILIDTGFAATADLLIDSIRTLGFDEKDICRILITHGHEDHAGGGRRLVDATRARISIHRRDVDTVERGTELTCGYYIYGVEEFETFKVDMPLEGGEVLDFGDVVIRVYHTPGHTPGCCSYEIPIRHRGRQINAFLFGGPGQWTFHPEKRSQGYDGDMEEYGRTLDFLSTLEVQVPLGAHPGQNHTFEKYESMASAPHEPNPFIDPQHWERFVRGLRESFNGKMAEYWQK